MILLFGAGGQVGQQLSHDARARNIALTSLSREHVDISDYGRVSDAIRHFKPSVVVNAAAYTNVDQAEVEPDAAFLANAQGPENVARACRLANIPVLHFSTDYVFDGKKTGPYLESDRVVALGVYGRSKAEGEDKVRAETAEHVILRTAWVYGEFGRNFLKTILRLAGERDELRVVADQRGNPTSTRQIAEAVFSIVPRMIERTCPFGTYHFAGCGVTTWHAFAEKIVAVRARFAGKSTPVVAIRTEDLPTKVPRPANSELDCDLFIKTFGVQPQAWSSECERVAWSLCRT